jgi:hypothetical protein
MHGKLISTAMRDQKYYTTPGSYFRYHKWRKALDKKYYIQEQIITIPIITEIR